VSAALDQPSGAWQDDDKGGFVDAIYDLAGGAVLTFWQPK
jgi:hypothetical protein